MELKKIGRKFYKTYRKEDGSKFKGLMGKPPMTGRYTNYALGGIVMFTAPDENLDVGDIFFSHFGHAILVMDNVDEESLGRTQKSFTLKTMNRELRWVRNKKSVDPISGVSETSEEKLFDVKIYASFEDDGKTSDTLQIQFAKYNIITNKDLQLEDTLFDKWGNEYVVIRTDRYVGVTVANVQKR